MTFDVAFIPSEIPRGHDAVCVVVDVLRASSTITLLFDKGCGELWLTEQVDEHLAREGGSGPLVCAESVEGYRLEGADFGPSLLDLEKRPPLEGRTVLMQTTNGTAAVHTLVRRRLDEILIGCMRNASAVMARAVALAEERGAGVYVVCAGRDTGTTYTIDDAYCAAYLAKRGAEIAAERGIGTALHDSARLALMSLAAYPDAERAFADSASGNIMRKVGRLADVRLCAMPDVSKQVPRLAGVTEQGFLRFTACVRPADRPENQLQIRRAANV